MEGLGIFEDVAAADVVAAPLDGGALDEVDGDAEEGFTGFLQVEQGVEAANGFGGQVTMKSASRTLSESNGGAGAGAASSMLLLLLYLPRVPLLIVEVLDFGAVAVRL